MNILTIGATVTLQAHSNELEPIRVFNSGTNPATNVEVQVTLPPGVTYASHTASAGVYNTGTGLWEIASLAGGADETLNIGVTIDDDTLAPFIFSYTVTHDGSPDEIPADDTATRTIEGLQCSQLQECLSSLFTGLQEFDNMTDAETALGPGQPFLASLANTEGWSYRAVLVTPLA